MWLLLKIVAIHEDVLAPRMTMEIHVKSTLPLLCERTHQLLDGEDYWVKDFGGVLPSSVEVLTAETAAVVPVDDSVRIEDGHYSEDKMLSQGLGFRRVAG